MKSQRWTGLASLVLFSHFSLAAADQVPAKLSDLSYSDAATEGLRANLDLIASKYGISLAEADALTAGLWSNPTLQIDTVFQPFGGNWNQTNAGGPRQYDLLVSYPLDLSGKHSAAEKSAREAVRVAEASFQDAVRQKLLQIRLAYIDLITLESQLALSRERQQSLQQLVQMIENKIGRRTLLPLLQRRAELAHDQAMLDRKQRESAVKSARLTLSVLLGRAPEDPEWKATTPLREFELRDVPALDSLIQEALSERPDLKALRLGLSKSDLDQDLAKAQAWDGFNLSAGLSSQGPISANPSDAGSNELGRALSWSAALQIPLPLFNRNQGNIRKAVLSREQTERQMSALALAIRQELSSLHEQLTLNRGLIQEYEGRQLARARRVRDSQQTQFGTGASALLDYFDAINAYQGTLSSYYDAVGEYRRTVARLNASVGKDMLQ